MAHYRNRQGFILRNENKNFLTTTGLIDKYLCNTTKEALDSIDKALSIDIITRKGNKDKRFKKKIK